MLLGAENIFYRPLLKNCYYDWYCEMRTDEIKGPVQIKSFRSSSHCSSSGNPRKANRQPVTTYCLLPVSPFARNQALSLVIKPFRSSSHHSNSGNPKKANRQLVTTYCLLFAFSSRRPREGVPYSRIAYQFWAAHEVVNESQHRGSFSQEKWVDFRFSSIQ
jgi:hypothetical protein